MTKMLSRRESILAGVGAAITAAGASGFPSALFAQSAVSVEDFLSLSKRLTGTTDLETAIARTLLGGFLATGNAAALTELVKQESEFTSHTELANAIVAAWYSGIYESGSGQALATYTDALVWNALTFTKPFAECGGETGYWSEPPER